MGRHVAREPDITSYNSIVTDSDPSEDGSIRIDSHIVFENGMPGQVERKAFFGVTEILGPEGHSLIQHYVIADYRSCSNHYACSVVDAEVFPYFGRWMYVYSGAAVSHLRNHPRNDRHS